MVIRLRKARIEVPEEEPRGFDAYDLRLGDLMRGERATMGKSLLDVEREIRIKASYIAAIENTDPDAFDTPGFIPGYVRSYARFLGMDSDLAFEQFCRECDFRVAHGMSSDASSIRKPVRKTVSSGDPLVAPATPYVPAHESILSRIEPGLVGSVTVLVVLISAIGYGGWTVLNEIQRVQFAPVENTPAVLADLEPLDGNISASDELQDPTLNASLIGKPVEEGLDRLYRPEALDVPVMVARDAPISTLNPAEVGTLVAVTDEPDQSAIDDAIAAVIDTPELVTPQVVADPRPAVEVVAVRPAWVRVNGADGSVLFEGFLNAGDTYVVPDTEEPPVLRVGESGAVYFAVNGEHYGPAGERGSVTANLALFADELTDRYNLADLSQDQDLSTYVAELRANASE